MEYRILTHENEVSGCFHKATGVLTAQRLEIASAQICTTPDGFVIDSFRVHDRDFAGPVPDARIDEVAAAITDTLSGRVRVEELFQRHRRFGAGGKPQSLSDLPAQVVIDNSSSERLHGRRCLLARPPGAALHALAKDFPARAFRGAGENRHAPRPGGRRVLCHRAGRQKSWKTRHASRRFNRCSWAHSTNSSAMNGGDFSA